MIKFLEDLIADLFGAKDQVAIPVRTDEDERRSDKFVRPTRGRK